MQTIQLMATPVMARQGDVLIVPVNNINESDIGDLLKEPDRSRVVLAHGEATGHAHAFYPSLDKQQGIMPKKAVKPVQLFGLRNADQYVEFDRNIPGVNAIITGCRLLRLREPAMLRHEEHDPIRFPVGDYVIVPQYEVDDSEELRRVTD